MKKKSHTNTKRIQYIPYNEWIKAIRTRRKNNVLACKMKLYQNVNVSKSNLKNPITYSGLSGCCLSHHLALLWISYHFITITSNIVEIEQKTYIHCGKCNVTMYNAFENVQLQKNCVYFSVCRYLIWSLSKVISINGIPSVCMVCVCVCVCAECIEWKQEENY